MSVLDASAILAFLQDEPGSDRVIEALPEAIISTVNLSEVAAKLFDAGLSREDVSEALGFLSGQVVEFDREQAMEAGALRPLTRIAGLSLGDRACLALASDRGQAAMTTDRAWSTLKVDMDIEVIR